MVIARNEDHGVHVHRVNHVAYESWPLLWCRGLFETNVQPSFLDSRHEPLYSEGGTGV